MKEFPKLDIIEIMKQDVSEILSSRSKSKLIHKTKDIDASGDEVEIAVRRAIRKKLPIKYYVSHGHIVDETLSTSNQLDIIIADNSGSPVLFTAENGTEYFPYESVYSIGEIKSTYYSSKKYIHEFVNNSKEIVDNFKREKTHPNQLTQDIKIETSSHLELKLSDDKPYKNPLNKFMVFVDSNDFKIEDIKDLYNNTSPIYLPNIVCLLDKGVIIKNDIIFQNGQYMLGNFNVYPEFVKETYGKNSEWVFIEFGEESYRSAANFSFLISFLNVHIKTSLVLMPDVIKYYEKMFSRKGNIIK